MLRNIDIQVYKLVIQLGSPTKLQYIASIFHTDLNNMKQIVKRLVDNQLVNIEQSGRGKCYYRFHNLKTE